MQHTRYFTFSEKYVIMSSVKVKERPMSRTFKDPVPGENFRTRVRTFQYRKACQNFVEQVLEEGLTSPRPRDLKLRNAPTSHDDLHFSHSAKYHG